MFSSSNFGKNYAQMLAERRAAEEKALRDKEDAAAQRGRDALSKDSAAGAELAKDVIGDGLGRLAGQEGIENSRKLLREQAAGPSSQEMEAKREASLEQLQAGQQSAQRNLQSSLAGSGVKGGAAGAQLARLAAAGITDRRRLERDLSADQAGRQAQAVGNLAQFETATSQFDLAQAAKEKNLDIQTRLGYAELGSAERASVRMAEATEKAAAAGKRKGKKGGK